MSFALIAFCIIIGLLIILAEIALIPGTTIVGFLGFASVLTGIFFAFDGYGSEVGLYTVAATVVLAGLMAYVVVKFKLWNWLALKDQIKQNVTMQATNTVKVGDRGLSVSAFRPYGKVELDGKIYEAEVVAGHLDPQIEVEVVRVEREKIIIQKV